MDKSLYQPVMWLVLGALIVGLMVVNSWLAWFQRRASQEACLRDACAQQLRFLKSARFLLWAFIGVLFLGGITSWYTAEYTVRKETAARRKQLWPLYDPAKIWEAPDLYLAQSDDNAELIQYGRQLISNTQDYFGPEGIVRPHSINGLNCQSCHLDAGAKAFGNNYFAVSSTYPLMRARSGTLETIPKRVNDCFERSLNGSALDTTSREMQAIVAYIQFLGTGVPKGAKPKGSGLAEVKPLDRPADPAKGAALYTGKCASCHGSDGQGVAMPDGSGNHYPPLWGARSYNQAAGLFRLSRFAGYIKANMPFGATFENPQLSDEECWDLAAFVNSQPRPEHPFLASDWPKIEKKPYDHPFGPFADSFPEQQHKFGPFAPIIAFQKNLK
jgi:thiosulfate dehydrogenase